MINQRELQRSNIIFDIAHVLFTPIHTNFEFDAVSFAPISAGVEILKQCAVIRCPEGKKFHQLFILSNLDHESLVYLKETFPEIFSLFDGIVISEMAQLKKPDPKIFAYLCNAYNLSPENSIFIDDRKENVIAAQSIGITGIWCDDFKRVAQELKILQIL